MHRSTRRRALARALPLLLAPTVLAPALAVPAVAATGPEVTELWLVDADTDARLFQLTDYDTLRLPFLPPRLTIEAVVTGSHDSVRMEIDHVQSSLENFEPYSLRGDDAGDFWPAPELRVPGWVTISAQAYSGPDLTGDAGDEVDLHLYLHQPDFVVRSAADVDDFDPGDGWCSTGKPPTIIDDLAWASLDQLLPFELAHAKLALARAGGDTDASARAEGLRGTLELDQRRASHDQREAAEQGNALAFAQVEQRLAPRVVAKAVEPGDVLADHDGGRRRSYEQRTTRAQLLEGDPTWFAHDHPLQHLDLDLDDLYAPVLPATTCTLRAAIEEANALPGRQSILVDSAVGPFDLHLGQLRITDGVDVIGVGGRAVVDADDAFRVMQVDGDVLVNLRSLELANGDPGFASRGGALSVLDDAYVQVFDSVLRDSRGNFGGGAYVDEATLVMWSSAVHDNIAGTPDDGFGGGGVTQRGGGIFNREGIVKLHESSVHDNLAVRGGGLSNFGGTMRVENSSVLDNEALAIGGGIENHDNGGEDGVLHLAFATVAGNEAGTSGAAPASHRVGGGLYNDSIAFMASSILADNDDAYGAGDALHAPDCHSPDAYAFKSYRHNVVGVLSSTCDLADYGTGTTAWIDHGSAAAPLNPGLLGTAMWDHRAYRLPNLWSPANDAGATQAASLYPCPDTDSRGRPRPVGAGCEIGSVERQ